MDGKINKTNDAVRPVLLSFHVLMWSRTPHISFLSHNNQPLHLHTEWGQWICTYKAQSHKLQCLNGRTSICTVRHRSLLSSLIWERKNSFRLRSMSFNTAWEIKELCNVQLCSDEQWDALLTAQNISSRRNFHRLVKVYESKMFDQKLNDFAYNFSECCYSQLVLLASTAQRCSQQFPVPPAFGCTSPVARG